MKKWFWIVIFSVNTLAQEVSLPLNLVTNKGKTFKNSKILTQNEGGIKIMHDGGMANLSYQELPADVLKILGVEALQEDEPEIKLPSPLKAAQRTYQKASLLAVEPDGIRIVHELGASKIPYEDLPADLMTQLGPFDPQVARVFREAETERNNLAQIATAKQREAALDAQNAAYEADKIAVQNQKQAILDHRDELLAESDLISEVVYVKLTATSKSSTYRDTTFATSYGSFSKEKTQARKMVCHIASSASLYQRVRLQCLFFTKEVTDGRQLAYEVVTDSPVMLGPLVEKTVEASATAQQTDSNYVALGLRYQEGVKYAGWAWRAIDGKGRVTAVYSSAPSYDALAWRAPVN